MAQDAARSSAAAADTSRIARVTVYPGSATVERVARVPAGARSLVISCLPASLDAQSLQISADPAVRVGEFNVLTEDRDVATACASPLDGRIRELEDQIAGVKAEASALQLVNGYLRGVAGVGAAAPGEDSAAATAATGRVASPTPAQITATADVLRKSGQDAFARAHQLTRKQEALELALKPLVAERDRVAGQRARVVTVSINLAAERDAELRLSYQVRGPGWQPTYRATLDGAKSTVLLERQALVAQNSGEDWAGVQLTLSTGQPGRATQGRLPRAWTLDVAPPPQPMGTVAPAMAMAAAAPPAPSPMARAKSAEEAMPSFDVSAIDKGFATEFAVPQRITVPSSGQRVTLALGNHTAPATLITRTAPAVEEAAYLVAHIAQPSGVWPAGSVGLYRDGAFVGTGRIDFAAASGGAPAGSTSLSFGRDELVTVRAEPAQDLTGSTGFTGSRTERKTRRTYSVENRHKTGITLQVLHAAPVSRNEKIEVESRYQPQPADMAWDRTPGTVAWQQSLAAGASAQFSAEHTVRYPKDIQLQERQ
ncbi:MAG: mucoidy inhibitor MuiA family protein [Comamonadaceae bacterium]|nr:MAG: mucoidy inhibitor MuiA family protein [Comamonadaceae bacterium]